MTAPTDPVREALAELVALEDLKRSLAAANHHAARFPTDENYEVIDKLSTEIGKRRPLALAAARAAISNQPEAAVTEEMVNRFLGWELPKTFSPDCGISFDGRPADAMGYARQWPIGTNLFTATEARAMLDHVLGAPPQAAQQRADAAAAERGALKELLMLARGRLWFWFDRDDIPDDGELVAKIDAALSQEPTP